MSGRDKTRFDDMIPFFGKADDERVRLYLRVLEDEYNILKSKFPNPGQLNNQPLKFTKREDLASPVLPKPLDEIPPQLQKGYHSDFINGGNAKEIHDDWINFFKNLKNRLANLTIGGNVIAPVNPPVNPPAPTRHQVSADYAKTILSLIKNTKDPFFVKVIQAHLEDLTGAALNDSSTWLNATNFRFKNVAGLYEIYENGIIPIAAAVNAAVDPDFPDTATNFPHFSINKYFLHKKLENAAAAASLGEDTFWSTAAPLTNVYYRNPSDPKKVFTTDANGVEVDVSRGSAEHLKLASDKCAGTKVKEGSTKRCDEYIGKCLVGNDDDIKACIEFMADGDFWDIMPKDVNEMIPSIIVDTLNKFGFQIDSSNKNYKLYESVGSWTQRLSNKIKTRDLTADEFNKISKNTKLNSYLDLLVTKVNQNPAIINENYFESSKLNPLEQGFRFRNWIRAKELTPRIILKRDDSLNIKRESEFITSNFARNRSIVQHRLAITPNGIFTHGVPFGAKTALFSYMVGGDGVNEKLSKHADHLKNLLKHVENKLQIMGKTLDVNTKEHIRKHIAQYEDAENKLFRAIAYSEEYIKLIEDYKEYDKNNVLNMDHLKSFVEARDKYFDKGESKQATIISTLQEIANSILAKLDEDPNKVSTTNPANSITRNN
jgi:hypothetical protein